MDHLTRETMEKLISVGFSYPDYEHFLNIGMLYAYEDDEYLIGGFSEGKFTKQDIQVAETGLWLPNSTQLLEWLCATNFNALISLTEEHYFSVQATDLENGMSYSGGGLTLSNALAKVIYKICKSKKREYFPEAKLRVQISAQE